MVTTTITAILSTISDITIPTFPDNNIQIYSNGDIH